MKQELTSLEKTILSFIDSKDRNQTLSFNGIIDAVTNADKTLIRSDVEAAACSLKSRERELIREINPHVFIISEEAK
jgi:hypothetical protein